MNSSPNVILVNKDGYRMELSRDLYVNVKLADRMVYDLGLADSDQDVEIPIGIEINEQTMDTIKLLLKNQDKDKTRQIEVPSDQAANKSKIDAPKCFMQEWEEEFADELDEDLLYSLMIASNYLEISALLDLCSSVVAHMIRGRTAEEVREILGIECDFTPEEAEKIHKENVWLSD